jgi:pyruvate,water dikinase
MKFIIPVQAISEKDLSRTGSKAYALGMMTQKGLNVPRAIAVTTEAYAAYVTETGLRTKIMMELNRKKYDDIRWEELWDISLRIRNMFANTPLPEQLNSLLKESVEKSFPRAPLVVRSSAPGEDSSETSFAGLHESYVNIRGADAVIEHIKLVWASLWSDSSLLYRKELGLDVSRSSMAVVVQEIINGDASGISFGRNPNDPSQCIIESVYGLNQALVDGTLEPDRWILDRDKGRIISHSPAERHYALYPDEKGTELGALPDELKDRPPLTEENVREIFKLVMHAEELFLHPQDVEWTIKDNSLYVLQSRPITTLSGGGKDDERGWYLSLKRSFENLKQIRHTIEEELIPGLQKEIEDLANTDLSHLSDQEIRKEAERRRAIFEKWKKTYWDYFIPFAHGMRLFGRVYNDTVHPDDPYEFLSLLRTGNLLSLQRNDLLQEMAYEVKSSDRLTHALKEGNYSDIPFQGLLQRFISSHGDLICRSPKCEDDIPDIINMVIEMSSTDMTQNTESEETEDRKQKFLSLYDGKKREDAEEMLDIGRASYSMRDNDNIYMGQLKARVLEAEMEMLQRSGSNKKEEGSAGHFDSVSLDVHTQMPANIYEETQEGLRLQERQITGHPAGPGIATGTAHIINNPADLMNFKKGEVLVCDSIDPNMTFVIPLASAVVERRGGMLIHGAIIAREYGLPCVTGISRATELIKTGDRITVDGYLGIVVIDTASHMTQDKK